MAKKLTEKGAIRILESFKELCKNHSTDIDFTDGVKSLARGVLYLASEERNANYVSEEALKLWDNNPTTLKVTSLRNLTVSKQRSNKKKYPFLKQLILEHVNPLSVLVEKIFDNNDDISKIIKNELVTCWIIDKENSKLKEKRWDKERPEGWEKCYKECGINFL